jgi:hypothetical protein
MELPPAPKNFKWVKILKDQSALLQPDGWFYREDHSKGTDAYFVTKEEVKDGGSFSTGLSLNVIYNIPKKAKVKPSEYALLMTKNIKEERDEVLMQKMQKAEESLSLFFLRVKDMKPGFGNVIIHYFLISNDQTGTLWMFWFEAPEKEWDEAWKTGSVLLNNLPIESEI